MEYYIIQLLLSNLNIHYSRKSIEEAIRFRKQSFTLSSIKDALQHFSIGSKCYKLELHLLRQFEFPLIAQIDYKKKNLLL